MTRRLDLTATLTTTGTVTPPIGPVPPDTAAALESAIEQFVCVVRADSGSHAEFSSAVAARDGLDRAITAHVEAEVARRLAAAPDVEQQIDLLRRASYTGSMVGMGPGGVRETIDRLRAAIAADKARAVEALKSGMRRVFKCSTHEVDPTKAWGCPDCLVELRRARPTPDEARSIGRVAEHLRGLAAEVEPSRMADGFEADRMRLLAHQLRQVAALMPDSDEARRLVEDLAGAQGAWVALLASNLADSGSIAGSEAVLAARVTAARTALLRALGVEA